MILQLHTMNKRRAFTDALISRKLTGISVFNANILINILSLFISVLRKYSLSRYVFNTARIL